MLWREDANGASVARQGNSVQLTVQVTVQPGLSYYACEVGSHCASGQKLAVRWERGGSHGLGSLAVGSEPLRRWFC